MKKLFSVTVAGNVTVEAEDEAEARRKVRLEEDLTEWVEIVEVQILSDLPVSSHEDEMARLRRQIAELQEEIKRSTRIGLDYNK